MNNNLLQVTPPPDELIDRYNALAFMQEIPSLREYAQAWHNLANDAESQNRPALAGMARARGEFYQKQAEGQYIRLLEGNFSELIQV